MNNRVLILLRFVMSFIMLWAFFDKLFGLGFSTVSDKSWIHGTSPTLGFLSFGTDGPFAQLFHSLAGNIVIDWLFMIGLLFIGLTLLLGVGVTIAAYSGALMMILLYLSVFPPKNNPIVDEHIVYFLVFLLFIKSNVGTNWGLAKWWSKLSLVKRHSFLK